MNKLKIIFVAVSAAVVLVWSLFFESDTDKQLKKADESINKSKKKIKDIRKGVEDEKSKNSVSGNALADRANKLRRR